MRFIISAVLAAFTFVVWATSVSAQDPAVVNSKTKKREIRERAGADYRSGIAARLRRA
jgi:hypothetical protein